MEESALDPIEQLAQWKNAKPGRYCKLKKTKNGYSVLLSATDCGAFEVHKDLDTAVLRALRAASERS